MRLRTGFMGEPLTIIGVVDDVAHNDLLAAPRPQAYRLYRQLPDPWLGTARAPNLVVRSTRAAADVGVVIASEVRAVVPQAPRPTVRRLADIHAAAYAQQSFIAWSLGTAEAAAALLAVVGLYGVLAYSVSRRTREIGIRMALGAQRGAVVRAVVGRGIVLVALGALAGGVGAFLLGGVLGGLLEGVGAHDPIAFTQAMVGFTVLGALASWLPARRAARVDPVQALEV